MNDNSDQGLFGAILTWFAHPFSTEGSALNWVLFVGLLVIAAFFWQIILIDILKEV